MEPSTFVIYIAGVAAVAAALFLLSRRFHSAVMDERSDLSQRIIERRRQRRDEILNETQTKRKEEIMKSLVVKTIVSSDSIDIDKTKEITLKDMNKTAISLAYDEELGIGDLEPESTRPSVCPSITTISISSCQDCKDGNNDNTSIDNSVDTATENDSPKQCPICFENYEVGDEVCFSRNEACSHTFKLECMMDWLMKHDDCPLCRTNYLMDSSSSKSGERAMVDEEGREQALDTSNPSTNTTTSS